MLSYILKRIALMLPTLLGVLTVAFVVIQFVPGGPVEQIMTVLPLACAIDERRHVVVGPDRMRRAAQVLRRGMPASSVGRFRARKGSP